MKKSPRPTSKAARGIIKKAASLAPQNDPFRLSQNLSTPVLPYRLNKHKVL